MSSVDAHHAANAVTHTTHAPGARGSVDGHHAAGAFTDTTVALMSYNEEQNPRPLVHTASDAAAGEAPKVSAEDLQRWRAVLEERRMAANGTSMEAHIANLSDILERLQEEEKPSQTEIRRMASSLGVPQKIDGDMVELQTLVENVVQAFRESVDTVQEHSGALASELSFGSGGEHPAVQRIMRDVREWGRQPREFNNPHTAAEVAERKLARQVREYKLRERVQDMLKSLTGTQETSSGSQHPAGQVPQNAASTALPTPALLLRKRAESERRASEPRHPSRTAEPAGTAELTPPVHAKLATPTELLRRAREHASLADAGLLEAVQVLGRYPRSLNAATQATASKERKAEENLFQRIKRRRKGLHDSCIAFLDAMKTSGAAAAASLEAPQKLSSGADEPKALDELPLQHGYGMLHSHGVVLRTTRVAEQLPRQILE